MLFNTPAIQKILVILFTTSAVLSMAQSCSIPGLGGGNRSQAPATLGILKYTTLGNGQMGFARANAGKDDNGQTQQQLLTPNSIIKTQRIDEKTIYALSFNRGLYKTENGGGFWNRIYILPFDATKVPQKSSLTPQEITDTNSLLAPNNNLLIRDFVVDENNPKNIFVAGQQNGFGKIFRSTNGGTSFQSSFTEVKTNTSVDMLAIFPEPSFNGFNIYAYTGTSNLIQSTDLGQTWTKIKDFQSRPVAFGFIKEEGNAFYTIFKQEGFSISTDGGFSWAVANKFLNTSSSSSNNTNNNSSSSIKEGKNPGEFTFAVQDKVAKSDFGDKAGWLFMANNKLWYTKNLKEPVEQIGLPFEGEQQNITAIAIDPIAGKNRMLVAIGNQLFESQNGGLSWFKKDIQIDGTIGSISSILIEPTKPEDFYLTLINPQLVKKDGVYN